MEELIKENLSRKYIETIACRNGYKCTKPDTDSGVDLAVTRQTLYFQKGKKRYLDSGEYIDLQLKSTTERSITFDDEHLKFDLEAKTYNDLVFRVNSNSLTPLYLLLFILPESKDEWVEVTSDELKLRKRAYWFIPKLGTPQTNNSSKIRIRIPQKQLVDLSFIGNCFRATY